MIDCLSIHCYYQFAPIVNRMTNEVYRVNEVSQDLKVVAHITQTKEQEAVETLMRRRGDLLGKLTCYLWVNCLYFWKES